MGRLRAGVSQVTITPPLGMFLMGYANRDKGAMSVHDDLTATALVLSDGKVRLALVACDLVFAHPRIVAQIRTRVQVEMGIPPGHVMICCSHTHSGPVTWHRASVATDRAEVACYLAWLSDRIVEAIRMADRDLQDAVWGVGRGRTTIGVNRRQRAPDGRMVLGADPAGTIDSELLVLRVDAAQPLPGKEAGFKATRPLAALVNYACHAVCLGSNSYAISADWPGVMRRAAEASTGARIGFIQGACADTNPLGGPQDTFDSAQRLGTQVAQEVARVYHRTALRSDAILQAAKRDLALPLLGPIGRDGRRVPPFEVTASRVVGLPPDQVMRFLDRRFPWAVDVADSGDGTWRTNAEQQTFCVGNMALTAVAAEPFAAIGQEIKAHSRAAFTIFAGYTNGSVGYLPTPQAYDQGGYEVDSSYVYYRLPAPLAPSCASMVIDGALSSIESLMRLNR